nr:hypothetical protein [Mycoplasmopsis bovis]
MNKTHAGRSFLRKLLSEKKKYAFKLKAGQNYIKTKKRSFRSP